MNYIRFIKLNVALMHIQRSRYNAKAFSIAARNTQRTLLSIWEMGPSAGECWTVEIRRGWWKQRAWRINHLVGIWTRHGLRCSFRVSAQGNIGQWLRRSMTPSGVLHPPGSWRCDVGQALVCYVLGSLDVLSTSGWTNACLKVIYDVVEGTAGALLPCKNSEQCSVCKVLNNIDKY